MRGRDHGEVVVGLQHLEEMFTVDPAALLTGDGRLTSGIDELVAELLARKRVRAHRRIVVTLPPAAIGPDSAATVEAAVRRYCRQRIEKVERDIRVVWRQGMRSLPSGTILFVIGLVLSSGFLEPDVPTIWQDVLGNGIFLVIAWVGLWYPLDLLFFARQPMQREMRILDRMIRMPVEVRAADERADRR